MVLERALGIGSLIQVEGPCDMDFKRTGFNEAIQPVEWRRVILAVVTVKFNARAFFGNGLDTIGIGGTSALTQSR